MARLALAFCLLAALCISQAYADAYDDCRSQQPGCNGDTSELRKVPCPAASGFTACYKSASGWFTCNFGNGAQAISCDLGDSQSFTSTSSSGSPGASTASSRSQTVSANGSGAGAQQPPQQQQSTQSVQNSARSSVCVGAGCGKAFAGEFEMPRIKFPRMDTQRVHFPSFADIEADMADMAAGMAGMGAEMEDLGAEIAAEIAASFADVPSVDGVDMTVARASSRTRAPRKQPQKQQEQEAETVAAF